MSQECLKIMKHLFSLDFSIYFFPACLTYRIWSVWQNLRVIIVHLWKKKVTKKEKETYKNQINSQIALKDTLKLLPT